MMNVFLHFVHEVNDVTAFFCSVVYNNQRMLFADAYIAYSFAFPSCLVDEICGGCFEIVFSKIKNWSIW